MTIITKKDFPYRNFINKFEKFRITPFKKKKLRPSMKIDYFGKWYSIKHYWAEFWYEDDWKNENEFKMPQKKHLFELKFKKNSLTNLQNPSFDKILVLKTKKDLILFCKKYMIKEPVFTNRWQGAWIDWNKVITDFGGIEIQVLLKSSKIISGKYTSWTYMWDCPSGCIWNDKIINKVIKII